MRTLSLQDIVIPGLDLKAGQKRADGATNTYLNFLYNFYHHGERYRSELIAAAGMSDPTELQQRTHGLRGVAAALGAFELDYSCLELLKELDQNNNNFSLELVGNIFHDLDKLLSGIKNSKILEYRESYATQEHKNNTIMPDNFGLVIVEDNFAFRRMLNDSLSEYFKVSANFSLISEAKSYLKSIPYQEHEVFIIDVELPDGSGIELAKVVADYRSSTFTILISGKEIPKDEYLVVDNCILLLKPFHISNLLNILEGISLNLLSQEPSKL